MSVKLQKGSAVRAFTVPMHLELIAPCATQSDISSIEPCHITIGSDGPQTENVNILWVREKNPVILHFFLKKSRQPNHLQVPQPDPLRKRYPLTGHFYISCYIYIIPTIPGEGAPYMFPYKVPTDRDTPSPQPLLYVYIHPSMLYLPQSPKSAPTYIRKTYSRRPRCHTQTEGLYTKGCGLVPEGDR